MPLNIDFLQILLHLLNFVILAGGLSFLLYRPVKKFLDDRQAHFDELEKQNQARAEENEKLRIEYEQKLKEADVEIAEKKKLCEQELSEVSAQYLKVAQEKAADIISAAEQDAEERKEHILESAQTEIGELVLAATQKLLSDTVTPERNRALYDEFIRLTDPSADREESTNDKK